MNKKKICYFFLVLLNIFIVGITILFTSSCSSNTNKIDTDDVISKIQNDINSLSIPYYDNKDSKTTFNEIKQILKKYNLKNYEIIKTNKVLDHDGNLDLTISIKIDNNNYNFIKHNIGWSLNDLNDYFEYNINNDEITLLNYIKINNKIIKVPNIIYDKNKKYNINLDQNVFNNCYFEKLDLSDLLKFSLINIKIKNLIIKNNYILNSVMLNKCIIDNFIILNSIYNLDDNWTLNNKIKNFYLNSDSNLKSIAEWSEKFQNDLIWWPDHENRLSIDIILFNNVKNNNVIFDYYINDDNTITIKKISGQVLEFIIPSYLKVNDKYLKIKRIESYAFENLITNYILLNDETIQLDEYCFSNNTFVKKIILPFKTKKLKKGLFKNCFNLNAINFLPNVSNYPESLFENCYSLLCFVFSDNFCFVKPTTFLNCFSVLEYNVPFEYFKNNFLIYKIKKYNIRFRMTIEEFNYYYNSKNLVKILFNNQKFSISLLFNNFNWNKEFIMIPSMIQVKNSVFVVNFLSLYKNNAYYYNLKYIVFPAFLLWLYIYSDYEYYYQPDFLSKKSIENLFINVSFVYDYQFNYSIYNSKINNLYLKAIHGKMTGSINSFIDLNIKYCDITNIYFSNKNITNKNILYSLDHNIFNNIYLYFYDPEFTKFNKKETIINFLNRIQNYTFNKSINLIVIFNKKYCEKNNEIIDFFENNKIFYQFLKIKYFTN